MTETQQKESRVFYREALSSLNETGIPFMLGGAFALLHYTGIHRNTKDLDVFCKPEDYLKILKHFADRQYRVEHTDNRWLAKIFRNEHFIDLIFDSPNHICTVDDDWFAFASNGSLEDIPVRMIAAEELIWCKLYIQNRERYDAADVNHILLRYGRQLDWNRLFSRMNKHWHLLLVQLLLFQFVYPADFPGIVPPWLFSELIRRAQEQAELPPPCEKVCLGPLIDQTQYGIDIREWQYKTYTMRTV
jgi:hypothetical protein